jgi:hypothetical protein
MVCFYGDLKRAVRVPVTAAIPRRPPPRRDYDSRANLPRGPRSAARIPRTPKLTKAQRSALPDWCFAIPETRDYPLTGKNKNWDPYHAKLALTQVARLASQKGPNPKIARRVIERIARIFPEVYRCELDLIQRIAIRHRLRRA